MTHLTIHHADPAEIPSLASAFAPHLPWIGEARLLDLLRTDDRRILVASVGGATVGIAGHGPAGYSRHAWALGPAATLPQHRGAGIGTALVTARLEAIDAAASRIGQPACVVHVASRRPAFWQGLGFVPVGAVGGTTLLLQCRGVAAGRAA